MMGVGSLLIWYFVDRHALKHIDSVLVSSRCIMACGLNGCLLVTGIGEEFGILSENLNTMLACIAHLNGRLNQGPATLPTISRRC